MLSRIKRATVITVARRRRRKKKKENSMWSEKNDTKKHFQLVGDAYKMPSYAFKKVECTKKKKKNI